MGNTTYFETKESPIICCKCNTPICNTLFAVNELKLNYCVRFLGILITTNLMVIKYTVDLKKITDSRNQCIICKEPTYSFFWPINFTNCWWLARI